MVSFQKICVATVLSLVGMISSTAAFVPTTTTTHHRSASGTPFLKYRGGDSSSSRLHAESEKPFAVVVQAEIEPDRMAEFIEMIETNAIETRKEPGCIRFDVLRSQDNPNQFIFYEVYENMGAIDHHKKQPHYNAWADFKESGGTISSVTYKNDAEFFT